MSDDVHENTSGPVRLPEPTFEFLVFSLGLQAQQQLGMLQVPGDEEEGISPDLALARHTIDLLAMLLDKTRGNLSLEEHRYLENSLTELRFRYVQAADSVAKRQEQPQS